MPLCGLQIYTPDHEGVLNASEIRIYEGSCYQRRTVDFFWTLDKVCRVIALGVLRACGCGAAGLRVLGAGPPRASEIYGLIALRRHIPTP